MAKNLLVTYILWAVGGWFGLHHFYLRRDKHAFIWWATFGGFGFGALREICKLSEYVEDANLESYYRDELDTKMKRPTPSFSMVRFIGEVMIGVLFGFLVQTAIPEDLVEDVRALKMCMVVVVPLAAAIGVWLVANVGNEIGSIKVAVIGAFIGRLVFLQSETGTQLWYAAIFAAIALNWKGKSWLKPNKRPKHGLCRRITVLGLCGMLYLSLWTSGIYHNASVTNEHGETTKLRDAVQNFFKSQAWTNTKESFYDLYIYYQAHGYKRVWEEFVIRLDPQGEVNAYKVLGLNSSATQAEITSTYRKLARQWHPDKQKDAAAKEKSQAKFMEIQQAYETLSNIKTRRAQKNERKRDEF